MERGLVARESDLPYRAIPAAAIRGRGPLAMARNGLTLLRGAVSAHRLLGELRPLAILGTGGYVCVPLFVAARLRGIPAAVYLPDVVPGLAVRLLARLSRAVACNVPDALAYFGGAGRGAKFVVTGYPVRRELFAQDRAACRAAFGLLADVPVLLVYGGSRGARSINRAVAALLPTLLPLAQIVHVCGREGDAAALRATAAGLPAALRARYHLFEYLHSGGQAGLAGNATGAATGATMGAATGEMQASMLSALGAADLTICRSGASTLGELPAARLPAVLVPYPFVHQDENADYLVRHGAAVKLGDGTLLGAGDAADGPLAQAAIRLLRDPAALAAMAERSASLALPDAAERLAELMMMLADRRARQ